MLSITYVLLYLAMYCYVLLCIAMYCYVLLCLAISCYAIIYLANVLHALHSIQALNRLSSYEVSGTLISKTSTDAAAAKAKASGRAGQSQSQGQGQRQRGGQGQGQGQDSGEDIMQLAGFANDVFPTLAAAVDLEGEEEGEEEEAEPASNQRLEINSAQIAALFRLKPEMAEFIFLELIAQPLKA
jgi:hypothetical protein